MVFTGGKLAGACAKAHAQQAVRHKVRSQRRCAMAMPLKNQVHLQAAKHDLCNLHQQQQCDG
jgi:uncharacterized protein with ACT and thioredoxin-like domain